MDKIHLPDRVGCKQLVFKKQSPSPVELAKINEVIIRKASAFDAAEIAHVHLNSWREAYRHILPKDFLNGLLLTFKHKLHLWEDVLKVSHSSEVFVAESPSGIVGFCAVGEARDADMPNHGEIRAIYLLETFQKRGIGFELLKFGLQELRQKKFEKVYCWMLKDNPVGSFYEQTGATRNPMKCKSEKKEGIALDEIMFIWNL